MRLAVALLVDPRHHPPLERRLDDRPGHQVRERDLHPAILEDAVESLPLGVEHVHREGPERGRRRHRATLVHGLGQHPSRPAQRLRLAGGRRGGCHGSAVAVGRRQHVGLDHLAARPRALDGAQVDPAGRCDPASHGRDPSSIGALGLALGLGDRRTRLCLLRRAVCLLEIARRLAGGHLGQDLSHLHGLVGLGADLGQRSARRGGHLGVDLVGGDLDHRLALLHLVALVLVPLEDRSLGDGLAHLRHHDLQHSAGSLGFAYVSGGFGRRWGGRFNRLHRGFVAGSSRTTFGRFRSTLGGSRHRRRVLRPG